MRPRFLLPLICVLVPAACTHRRPDAGWPAAVRPQGVEQAATGQANETSPNTGRRGHRPPSILASISPSTRPDTAASLRLADEGRRRFLDGDVHGALERLEQAVKIDPANPYGYYWLARVHYRQQRYDQAIAFTEKASVLFAQSDFVWLGQTHAFAGAVFEEVGRYADARAAYRRALDADPGNVAAQAGLARLGRPPTPATGP